MAWQLMGSRYVYPFQREDGNDWEDSFNTLAAVRRTD
jgi:hypothetical protein